MSSTMTEKEQTLRALRKEIRRLATEGMEKQDIGDMLEPQYRESLSRHDFVRTLHEQYAKMGWWKDYHRDNDKPARRAKGE